MKNLKTDIYIDGEFIETVYVDYPEFNELSQQDQQNYFAYSEAFAKRKEGEE